MTMIAIILASQLWFGSYHAMVGAKDMTPKKLAPIEQEAYASKAECLSATIDGVDAATYITLHRPKEVTWVKGMKWVRKCSKKAYRIPTELELNAIHDAPNHEHMEGM